MGSLGSRVTRVERKIVGAGMRLVALFAERKVRSSLADGAQTPRKRGLHVRLDQRGRRKN